MSQPKASAAPGSPPAQPARAEPTSERVVPVPDAGSAPFWAAAAEHVLVLGRCSRCAAFAHPPEPTCPSCHSADPGFVFEPVQGGGVVRSWTVVRQSALPALSGEVPFVLVDVELDAQADLRLIGRLLDGPDAPVGAGDRVAGAWEDVADGVAIPAFRLRART